MDHDEVIDAVVKGAIKVANSVLPAPAAVLADLIRIGLGKDGTERLREAEAEEVREAVFARLPEVERKMHALSTQGVPINVSDFLRVLEHFGKAWTKAADSKKRERLEAAFVRSFDKELYESGLLNALWERLDRLSYGDLRLLRDLHEAGEHRDAVKNEWRLAGGDSLGRFHGQNLDREGLVWSPYKELDGIRPNDLGKRLYDLAWEQLSEPD